MATPQQQSQQQPPPHAIPNNIDRYVVIHVATTCDEHGVYVTKDSAEVIEFGWILLDAKSCEEVSSIDNLQVMYTGLTFTSCIVRAFLSSQ
jgi:hypothetical protein